MNVQTSVALASLFLMCSACRPPQTWLGTISDSTCGARHPEDEHAAPLTNKECTAACIRSGAKYAFVLMDGHVFEIANQGEQNLATFAGDTVRLTGTMEGGTVSVSHIELATRAAP